MAKRKREAPSWRVPDELWERVEPLLPKYRKSRWGGRPRVDRRRVLDGILYVLRTGCQWKAVPREFGAASTLHDYFQEWTEKGVFFRLWKEALREYDALEGIDWGWQSLDGAMTKAPLGGEKNRPQSDGPRQVRHEAFLSYGWRRRAARAGRRGKRVGMQEAEVFALMKGFETREQNDEGEGSNMVIFFPSSEFPDDWCRITLSDGQLALVEFLPD